MCLLRPPLPENFVLGRMALKFAAEGFQKQNQNSFGPEQESFNLVPEMEPVLGKQTEPKTAKFLMAPKDLRQLAQDIPTLASQGEQHNAH